jgi:hypothetical protein
MRILLSVGSALVGGTLLFQMPATPPMKMGLWESVSTTKMSGMDMPQGMSMPNMTVKVRACMTPESYAKNLTASQRQTDCVRSHEVWTAKSFSLDISCKSGSATGHYEVTFDSPGSSHTVSHMTMNSGGHPMQMDMTSESHFVSSDCGAVTPDKPQITH